MVRFAPRIWLQAEMVLFYLLYYTNAMMQYIPRGVVRGDRLI